MKMRLANVGDVPDILRWREDAAPRLRQRGSDQWSDAGLSRGAFIHRVTESTHAGDTWIAEDENGAPLGTIAVDSTPDPS